MPTPMQNLKKKQKKKNLTFHECWTRTETSLPLKKGINGRNVSQA